MKRQVRIIGGSVAGLGTALELLRLNPSYKVSVYEKKRYVGENTVCGGAISSFMVRDIGLKIPRHIIASTIDHVRIYAPNGSFWELHSSQIYAYVLWRELFERHLYTCIQQLGSKVYCGSNMRNVVSSSWRVNVAADGLTGICRKELGLPFPTREDIHIGVQRRAVLPKYPNNRIDLYFDNCYAPKGYAWVFPEGTNHHVRVGLGIPMSIQANPTLLLSKFIDKINACPIGPVQGKLIPTAMPEKSLVHNNFLMVGDAGLLCDPSTGGGIATALLSGKCAARAINENNLKKHDVYTRGLRRTLRFRYKIKKFLYSLADEDLNEFIQSLQNFHPHLTRISWALVHALLQFARKKPRLVIKHKTLRRMLREFTT